MAKNRYNHKVPAGKRIKRAQGAPPRSCRYAWQTEAYRLLSVVVSNEVMLAPIVW